MKPIYPILACLLLATACGTPKKNPEATCLEGEIEGLGNDTLYLYGADRLYPRTDTLPVKEGRLEAMLQPDTLVVARLVFPDGNEVPLFMDKGQRITINGPAADLNLLDIKGNTPNEELTAFRQELQEMETPSEQAVEEKAVAFINSHPASLASIYLLEKYLVQKPRPDLARIRKLIEQMPGELKDRPAISQLTERLEASEKTEAGKTLPFFTTTDAQGERITRSTFKGKYLLIHFWASWDQPSREANAAIRHIYRKERKNKDLAFLGISLDIDRQAWLDAVEADTLEWEQGCNLAGWQDDAATRLGIQALPTNLLIAPNGKIEAKDLDEDSFLQTWEKLNKKSAGKKK